jgi:hypothetical protein
MSFLGFIDEYVWIEAVVSCLKALRNSGKIRKTSARLVGNLTKIRIRYLLNTNVNCHYTNLLCMFPWMRNRISQNYVDKLFR